MRLMTSVVHATFVVLLLAHWGSPQENEICNRKSEACTDSNNDILSKVSLHVDYFQQGSKAVQVAYYATIAGGIELNELSIKVSRLALDMKRLHTKYIVMIVKHKAHFKSMLDQTEVFMSFIHDDFLMHALKVLEFTESDITKIAQSAVDLRRDLKAVIDQCFHLYEEAMRLMADNKEKQRTLDIERQEYEQRKSMNERLLESHRNEMSHLRDMQEKYKKHEISRNEEKTNFLTATVNFVTRVFTRTDFIPPEYSDQQAASFKTLRHEMEDKEQQEKVKIDQIMEDLIQSGIKLRENEGNAGTRKNAIDALQYGIQALLRMVRNMEDMDVYWKIRVEEMEMLRTAARNFQKLMLTKVNLKDYLAANVLQK